MEDKTNAKRYTLDPVFNLRYTLRVNLPENGDLLVAMFAKGDILHQPPSQPTSKGFPRKAAEQAATMHAFVAAKRLITFQSRLVKTPSVQLEIHYANVLCRLPWQWIYVRSA